MRVRGVQRDRREGPLAGREEKRRKDEDGSQVSMPLASAGPGAAEGLVAPGCFLFRAVKKAAVGSRGDEFHSLLKSSSGRADMKPG